MVAFGALGAGMFTAIATTLPNLDTQYVVNAKSNSVLLADDGKPIASLTGDRNRILLKDNDISPNLQKAVVSIEDRRFYQNTGVDYRGILRAFWQDLRNGTASQGGSTLTQQFVKNALTAQDRRSVAEKVREALLAQQLEKRWSKQAIMTHYLNTAYFGNGAYGAEAALRTYFGDGRRGYNPDERLARNATPGQAALIAGMIANPTLFNPGEHPQGARARRNEVLQAMLSQHAISDDEYKRGLSEPLPPSSDIHPPQPDSKQPYFSSFIAQHLVDAYGPGRAYGGGLQVKTTLDENLQRTAEQVVNNNMKNAGPQASLVAIDNKSGQVKAMVGGNNFDKQPFDLATEAHRQPGSTFKPFTLVEALREGIRPSQTFVSAPKDLPVSQAPYHFVVHNDDNVYTGPTTLSQATTQSDNSIFAELGLRMGPQKIAQTAHELGVVSPIQANPAITLGGLSEGVTPLEMAYAYSTIANQGHRVSGSMFGPGPTAIESVQKPGEAPEQNKPSQSTVFNPMVANEIRPMLGSVVQRGTAQKASIGSFAAGKTGTTENNYDAWFIGFTDKYTVAVWVGYPNGDRPMNHEYHGKPVTGGTFPTDIWHDFMSQVGRMEGWLSEAPPPVERVVPDRPRETPQPQPQPNRRPQTQSTQPQRTQTQPQSQPQPQSPPPSGGGGGGGGGGLLP
jgi:penicillin-binding protein 1A